jgi:cytochrome P450
MIFELGVHLELQDRLRAELQTIRLSTDASGNDPLTAEELSALDKLPLLDAVVRETNRLHPPVPMSNRVALADDAVPVSQPYTDRFGTLRDTVLIQKGDEIHIPIVVVNRSKVLWGPDAREWKYVFLSCLSLISSH